MADAGTALASSVTNAEVIYLMFDKSTQTMATTFFGGSLKSQKVAPVSFRGFLLS